jgi:hypothetical protein
MWSARNLWTAAKVLYDYTFRSEQASIRDAKAMIGLPFAEGEEMPADVHALIERLRPLVRQMNLGELAAHLDAALETREALSDGTCVHEVVLALMQAPIAQRSSNPRLCEEILAAYEAWWQEAGRGPRASAIYAMALGHTGFAWRGDGWASDVTDEGWEKLQLYARRARLLLEATAEAAGDDYVWHRISFSLSLIEGAPRAEQERRFERLQKLDPYNMRIYDERLVQLLPRWGGSYQEIEIFARQSVAATHDRLGTLLYARVYHELRTQGHEDVGRTLLDWDLELEALADWLDRVPGQALANRYAQRAHQAGRLDIVHDLFEREIAVIHPNEWAHILQAAVAFRDCGLAQMRATAAKAQAGCSSRPRPSCTI